MGDSDKVFLHGQSGSDPKGDSVPNVGASGLYRVPPLNGISSFATTSWLSTRRWIGLSRVAIAWATASASALWADW
eukprot:8914748-Pyramimonas_sp.AAC.1